MAFLSPMYIVGDLETLWHKRLGHANMKVILKLNYMSLFKYLPNLGSNNHSFNTCKIVSQVHASPKINTNKALSQKNLGTTSYRSIWSINHSKL